MVQQCVSPRHNTKYADMHGHAGRSCSAQASYLWSSTGSGWIFVSFRGPELRTQLLLSMSTCLAGQAQQDGGLLLLLRRTEARLCIVQLHHRLWLHVQGGPPARKPIKNAVVPITHFGFQGTHIFSGPPPPAPYTASNPCAETSQQHTNLETILHQRDKLPGI